MRKETTNTPGANAPFPTVTDPETIQEVYDTLDYFFDEMPLNKVLKLLNGLFCDRMFYDPKEHKTPDEHEERPVSYYKERIKWLKFGLEKNSDFAGDASRIIEFFADVQQLVLNLTEKGMKSTACWELEAMGKEWSAKKAAK